MFGYFSQVRAMLNSASLEGLACSGLDVLRLRQVTLGSPVLCAASAIIDPYDAAFADLCNCWFQIASHRWLGSVGIDRVQYLMESVPDSWRQLGQRMLDPSLSGDSK